MLPSVNLNIRLPAGPNISVWKSPKMSLCENGVNESPRYQEMVGLGLPEETQAMLTESPSCTVTVPFRSMVVGVSVCMKGATNCNGLFIQFQVHNKYFIGAYLCKKTHTNFKVQAYAYDLCVICTYTYCIK